MHDLKNVFLRQLLNQCLLMLMIVLFISCNTKPVNKVWPDLTEFDPNKHHSNTLIIIFNDEDEDVLGNFTYPPALNQSGYIRTGVRAFDHLSRKYRFTEMLELYCPSFDTYPIWKGYSDKLVFRITLAENREIEKALDALLQESCILTAYFYYKKFPVSYPPFDEDKYPLISFLLCYQGVFRDVLNLISSL